MSNTDKVRALYGDITWPYLISEETITLYLEITHDNVLRAAACAVRAIAVDEVLLKGYLKTDDLTVDGVKGAESLRVMAKDFEERARVEERDADSEGFDFLATSKASYVPEAAAVPWRERRCL